MSFSTFCGAVGEEAGCTGICTEAAAVPKQVRKRCAFGGGDHVLCALCHGDDGRHGTDDGEEIDLCKAAEVVAGIDIAFFDKIHHGAERGEEIGLIELRRGD